MDQPSILVYKFCIECTFDTNYSTWQPFDGVEHASFGTALKSLNRYSEQEIEFNSSSHQNKSQYKIYGFRVVRKITTKEICEEVLF